MGEISKQQRAEKVYATICAALEERNWVFKKEEEKLLLYFGVKGDDLPMNFIVIVDVQSQTVRLLSALPFEFSEEKRLEAAVATCALNFLLGDGSFDVSLTRGSCWFRLAASFEESEVGVGLFQRMISYSTAAVDAFNEHLEGLATGKLSLPAFLQTIEPK